MFNFKIKHLGLKLNMSETPLKEIGFDRLKVQNTQSYTLTQKNDANNPFQSNNKHTHTLICTCHMSLKISHLLYFVVEKQSSTHPRSRLYTRPYSTHLECGIAHPQLPAVVLAARPFFFLPPSFQFSKLQLAYKLNKISDPSEFRELFEASQFQLQSSPSLSVFLPSFSNYPSLPLTGLVNEDEESDTRMALVAQGRRKMLLIKTK